MGNNKKRSVDNDEHDGYRLRHTVLTKKGGVIVCILHFRPLTLLNADFKLLSRLSDNNMKRWINNIMHPNQHCRAYDNNIYGAITAIRETIAKSELTNTPTCILTLDFKDAFDNITHTYLFSIMEAYGFSTTFRDKYGECTQTQPPRYKLTDISPARYQ
jgi:hypothetical protein